MKSLADYIHGRGLKFGVYTARCRFTCQLFAASFGHEAVDAKQWAEWGIDYVKVRYRLPASCLPAPLYRPITHIHSLSLCHSLPRLSASSAQSSALPPPAP